MLILNKIKRFVCGYTIAGFDGSGHHPSNIRTGSLREKILPPIIKNDTPWIGNGKLSSPFQMFSCRIISIKTPVGPTHRAIGRLRSEEHTSELQSRENLVCRL